MTTLCHAFASSMIMTTIEDHERSGGLFGWLFHGHKHEGAPVDSVLEASADGIRTLKISLVGLLTTAVTIWYRLMDMVDPRVDAYDVLVYHGRECASEKE